MNFLAHLHLAHLANSSLPGNLAADFVRGDPAHLYDPQVVEGIRMHRRVDSLTDSLPAVKEARRLFSEEYRRVAPITMDVLWDHFLALHWQKLEADYTLPAFVSYAQGQILPSLPAMPAGFQQLNRVLWPERWLERYAGLPFIENVLARMAARRPRLHQLAGSFVDIERNYPQFETIFFDFYPQMMETARRREL
ncbi:MAG: ACP phosphodiesterase [Yersiniaceae bacterium]|uniref:ACP phosphodiesterase n=1 Tax=Chimaeribacter coloradensis TaxID=2060068 RepID=A0A2N5EAW0_9GAMM|nr:ACP phosphodiesterase [Chimaeribacter coloradensis]MDU6411064.1 ACP phosphodiesterase [Yersiniaceae bacterium]PLR39260.1 ACP phosphodiesterase [Chimaeribacter coloradensis]